MGVTGALEAMELEGGDNEDGMDIYGGDIDDDVYNDDDDDDDDDDDYGDGHGLDNDDDDGGADNHALGSEGSVASLRSSMTLSMGRSSVSSAGSANALSSAGLSSSSSSGDRLLSRAELFDELMRWAESGGADLPLQQMHGDELELVFQFLTSVGLSGTFAPAGPGPGETLPCSGSDADAEAQVHARSASAVPGEGRENGEKKKSRKRIRTLRILGAAFGNNLGRRGAGHAARFLSSRGCHLRELDLFSASLGPGGAEILAAALPACESLRVLDLGGCGIGVDGCAAIAAALDPGAESRGACTGPAGQTVVVPGASRTGCAFGTGRSVGPDMTPGHFEPHHPMALDLRSSNAQNHDPRAGTAGEHARGIIDRDGDPRDRDAARSRAPLLQRWLGDAAIDVDIDASAMGDGGWPADLRPDALGETGSDEEGRVRGASRGRMSPGRAPAAAPEALEPHPSCPPPPAPRPASRLAVLRLCSNSVGDRGAAWIAESLRRNVDLTELDLFGNGIGPRGAECLASSLRDNVTLRLLRLDENRVGPGGRAAVAAAMDARDWAEAPPSADCQVAMCMINHIRLGAHSPARVLPSDIVRRIASIRSRRVLRAVTFS